MSDANNRPYPQIPATVWWGLREKFKRSIPITVTESYLAAELNVQATAAKAYLTELKRLGLLDDQGKPNDVAKKWRMDQSYREAADQLLKTAYPRELIETAPPQEGNRDKAVRWFMSAAELGEGAAKNKAATYFMIGASDPPDDSQSTRASVSKKKSRRQSSTKSPRTNDKIGETGTATMQPPLNVNVQIHISADATNDQIESIFSNMKKYLT